MTEIGETDHTLNQAYDNTMLLRIPKPNLQVLVLGLIAMITLFQTFQLVSISSKTSSAKITAAPANTNATNGGSAGTGSNASVPQSMVGGC